MSRGIVGVLLAAGQGRRFGGNKLLQPLADGTPMALAAARHLHTVLADSLAVVADTGSELAGLLAGEGLQVVANSHAAAGIGTSIACGVTHSVAAQGWVIALADMPYIPVAIIRRVVAGLEAGADIIAPVYGDRRGHPVGFSARHAAALMQLHSDEGARSVIAAHSDSLELLAVDDRGVIVDIDYREPWQ